MTAAIHDHARWATARHAVPRARATSNAQQLLQIIQRERRVTTAELCDMTGSTSAVVWGALAYHIKLGRIRFEAGDWIWIDGVVTPDEQRAAAFLRARGWAVQEPQVQEENEDDHD